MSRTNSGPGKTTRSINSLNSQCECLACCLLLDHLLHFEHVSRYLRQQIRINTFCGITWTSVYFPRIHIFCSFYCVLNNVRIFLVYYLKKTKHDFKNPKTLLSFNYQCLKKTLYSKKNVFRIYFAIWNVLAFSCLLQNRLIQPKLNGFTRIHCPTNFWLL